MEQKAVSRAGLVFKQVVVLLFSRRPILLLIFITFISSYFAVGTSSFAHFFFVLTILFFFCIVSVTIGFIYRILSRYYKLIAWLDAFWMAAAVFLIGGFTNQFVKLPTAIEFILTIFWIDILVSLIIYLLILPVGFIYGLVSKLKWKIVQNFVAYVNRLLYPLYLFPIKLLTYSTFYILVFSIRTAIELLKLLFDIIRFPFSGVRHFITSIFIVGIGLYLIATAFVTIDYLRTHYGYYGKFLCSVGTKEKLKKKVVRIVGGYSEGTGFFVANNQVITNFHVISGEPSPKIIFPDGKFITPTKMTGDKLLDLAILFTQNDYPEMVMPLPDKLDFKDEEPLIATGYAQGTDLLGDATVTRGNFIDFRTSKAYIQTNMSLVPGMSGGPLTDQCGAVVGINTQGLAGLSLSISADMAKYVIPKFTDQNIEKINVDPSKSPEDAVKAFYIYLKARRMEDGFKLLSREYLQKTNFEEWTNRFLDILDVDVIKTEMVDKSKDTVSLKFSTKNWVNKEVEYHYYEGTWQTILEDGVYKMLKSNIKEVLKPPYIWFYE
jgi:hypothetical protein